MKPVFGKALRFCDQMFAAAKSDFETDIVDGAVEQPDEIGATRACEMSIASRGSKCAIRSA